MFLYLRGLPLKAFLSCIAYFYVGRHRHCNSLGTLLADTVQKQLYGVLPDVIGEHFNAGSRRPFGFKSLNVLIYYYGHILGYTKAKRAEGVKGALGNLVAAKQHCFCQAAVMRGANSHIVAAFTAYLPDMEIFGVILCTFLKYIFKPFQAVVADTDVSVFIKPTYITDSCVTLVIKQVLSHLLKAAVKVHLNLVILVIGLTGINEYDGIGQ